MRILQQFFNVLEKLINNFEPEKVEDIKVQLSGMYFDYLGKDISFFQNSEMDTIMKALNGGTDKEVFARVSMLSELLYYSAILSESDAVKMDLLSKVLSLLRYIDEFSGSFSFERQRRIDELEDLLGC